MVVSRARGTVSGIGCFVSRVFWQTFFPVVFRQVAASAHGRFEQAVIPVNVVLSAVVLSSKPFLF
jgi:hypothetical protein